MGSRRLCSHAMTRVSVCRGSYERTPPLCSVGTLCCRVEYAIYRDSRLDFQRLVNVSASPFRRIAYPIVPSVEAMAKEGLTSPERSFRPKSSVLKYVTVLTWLPKYSQLDTVSDLVAGITLGLTMIPQSIAYAALAGLTAQVSYCNHHGTIVI